MERLTHRDENGKSFIQICCDPEKPADVARQQTMTLKAVIDKLAHFEDMQDEGRLVELPCALGTTVWTTKWWDDVTETVKVDGKKFHRRVMKHKVTKTKFSLYDLADFGETVFLTREEAEAALKGGDLNE